MHTRERAGTSFRVRLVILIDYLSHPNPIRETPYASDWVEN